MLKYHSDMGHCFSKVEVVSKIKVRKKLNWEKQIRYLEKGGYFRLRKGPKSGP